MCGVVLTGLTRAEATIAEIPRHSPSPYRLSMCSSSRLSANGMFAPYEPGESELLVAIASRDVTFVASIAVVRAKLNRLALQS